MANIYWYLVTLVFYLSLICSDGNCEDASSNSTMVDSAETTTTAANSTEINTTVANSTEANLSETNSTETKSTETNVTNSNDWSEEQVSTLPSTLDVERLAGQPLYLTPLIEAGDLKKARLLSEVHLQLDSNNETDNVISHSGFITINADAESYLFIWFFPSADANPSAPLLIWLGKSLEGVFGDSGPYAINEDLKLEAREQAWTDNNNVLYIDAPIGSGFSTTSSDDDYAADSVQLSGQLYKCLLQFFTLFGEQQNNDIYIVGKSYAGKFAETLAYYIHSEDDHSPVRTKLKGIILLSGLMEPLMDLTPANYLYQVGLVNEKQVMYFKELSDLAAQSIQSGDYEQANSIVEEQSRQFESVTGLTSDLDILADGNYAEPPIYDRVRDLLKNQDAVDSVKFRNAIHVGNTSFQATPFPMLNDQFKSYDIWLGLLLDNNFKVLIVGGQFDAKYNPAVTDQAIGQLNWKWTKDYFGSPRKISRYQWGSVSGYVTTLHNLYYVTLRRAGHHVAVDQPEAVLKAVNGFIRNENF